MNKYKKYVVASSVCLFTLLASCLIFSIIFGGKSASSKASDTPGFYIFGIVLFVATGMIWRAILKHYTMKEKLSSNKKK